MSQGRQLLLDEEYSSSSEQKSVSHVSASSEITGKDIILGRELGHGSTATVFLGEYNHRQVVIKHFNQPKPFPYPTPDQIALFEFNTLRACFPSDYIVKPVAYSMNPPVVLLEYAENGTLLGLLGKEDALSWNQRIRIAHDVALGLIDLKKIHFVHRDIKSDNILMTKDFRAKLTDLDLARDVNIFTKEGSFSLTTGSYGYMAPECWTYQYDFLPYAADVYSFGVLLIELGVPSITFEEYLQTDEQNRNHAAVHYEIRSLTSKKEDGSLSDDKSSEDEIDMVGSFTALQRYQLLKTMIDGIDASQWPSGYLALAKECIALDPKERPSIDDIAKRLDDMLKLRVEVTSQPIPSLKDKPHLWARSSTTSPVPIVSEHQTKCMPKCVIL